MTVHPVDERLVADTARALRGDADLPYSARQLWYAVCARLEPPQVTKGIAQLVAGALLVVIGIVFGILATVFVAPVVPVGMVVFGMGVQQRRFERSRPTTRMLAVSYDAFVRETLEPMRGRGGEDALPGLLALDADAGDVAGRGEEVPLVVCDRPETAALVAAAAGAAGFAVEVADEQSLGSPLPARRLHALHDADPRGCALPVRLAASGATDVVDVGLRPAHITGRRIPIIEGAPALVPRDLSGLLTADEIVWLADGHRVELAVLGPADLVEGLRTALAAPVVQPPGVAPAQITLGGASPIPPPPEPVRHPKAA